MNQFRVYMQTLEETIKLKSRTDIINFLIRQNQYTSYLEIGVANPRKNFAKIKVRHKDGVDPAGRCNHPITSDTFFKTINSEKKYDIIFIDGLHIEEQVDRDIKNALDHLAQNGIVVMHDCNPPTKKHQRVPRRYLTWTGTVWKSFVKLRCSRPDLCMCVVDIDWGCGIIKKGSQEIFNNASLDRCLKYSYLDMHREELLNLVDTETFKRWTTLRKC